MLNNPIRECSEKYTNKHKLFVQNKTPVAA